MESELNAQEISALQHVADGLPNKQIAEKIGYARSSMNNFMSDIYRKMGVYTRTEAVVMALRKGIVK